jgi:hypothetical protein
MTRKNYPFFPILGIWIYLVAGISLGNIVSVDKESATGEKNYMCLPSDANDFSTRALFCDTNIADCIQPSGRHKN